MTTRRFVGWCAGFLLVPAISPLSWRALPSACAQGDVLPPPVVYGSEPGPPGFAPGVAGGIVLRAPTAYTDAFGNLTQAPNVDPAPAEARKAALRPTRIAPAGSAPQIVDQGPMAMVEPNLPPVALAAPPLPGPPAVPVDSPVVADRPVAPSADPLREALGLGESSCAEEASPDAAFDQLLREEQTHAGGCWRPLVWLLGPAGSDGGLGIGAERAMHAPFELDTTQPLNQFRFRFDAVYGYTPPDRAEYLWARPRNVAGGRGPLAPEPSIDYQDFRSLLEVGGRRFSVATEIPIRVLDPVNNGNTAGLGDMNVTTKMLLLDGHAWQLTQIFRTYLNTGAVSKGLSNGHVSLEPGLLARYQWSDQTYLHGELKLWFPIGGHPEHSGPIVRYGVGVSRVWYDADTFAVIPTLEFAGQSVLDGQTTLASSLQPVDVDGDMILQVHPGLRFVWDTCGDCGLLEFGISGALDMGSSGWYENLLRIEFRKAF